MYKRLKNYFHPITQLEKKRKALSVPKECSQELRRLLRTPLPKPDKCLDELDFLVLDFETTGLNPTEDSLLSIGNIRIENNQIDMDTAAHCYLDDNQKIKAASAVVNHIMPQMLLEGEQLEEAMNRLFIKMTGKIVMAHGAVVERSFMQAYVRKRYGLNDLPIIWLDTLKIEKHLVYHSKGDNFELQLNAVRQRYGLPLYSAHNALVDAISTAELFMAQKIKIFGRQAKKTTIGEMYCRATC
ncbi:MULTISPECIES: exonuclease domain-containing protein [Vibrio]|uniref:3'-5' exonuclease n=1 Tax=Vibrio casei TaxID=673372 RepID=A0A368LI73_9VIBR|nr:MULTISPECIES: exonuclease domain-containing protein [Vibrio]RCS70371.1 3'-5' exonuclease [Vibrio casei]SJN20372.1 DNA polymerase III epsilon subunit [Vibrio casei]HBV77080.1 3'-5' exonuclease [Vibrio sp.]